MKKLPLLGPLLGGLLLTGCAQFRPSDPPIVVNVKSDGDQCLVTVVRNLFVQPLGFTRVSQAQLLRIGRETKSRRAIVVSDMNAKYKCIGATIITLHQAGFSVDLAPWDNR